MMKKCDDTMIYAAVSDTIRLGDVRTDGQTNKSPLRCAVSFTNVVQYSTSCVGGRHNMPPAPCKLIFDLLTLKVVSEYTCDMGYLCANFSLPRPLCSRLKPDVRDRQTDVTRQKCIIA